jgi:hypothetical protein
MSQTCSLGPPFRPEAFRQHQQGVSTVQIRAQRLSRLPTMAGAFSHT